MRTPLRGFSAPVRRRVVIGASIAALLLAPLLAMQITDEVAWSATDFVLAAVLLGSTGLAYEIVASNVQEPTHRYALTAVIVAIAATIWAQGAIGLFE